MKIFYNMVEARDINIIDYKELDLENIYFSHPKKVKGGSYISEAYYKGENHQLPVFIQTPKLVNTTGIVKNESRSYIELELDQSHYPFFKFVTDLDDHNIVNIQKNSLTWFNKHFPIDVVEEFYKTPIKIGKNKTPPKFRVKIPVSKNSITCNIYDQTKNIIDFTNVKKSNKVICVLEFVGLRFLKQQVLCEWNPVQIKLCDTVKVVPQKYLINEDLLTDDEETSAESSSVNNVELSVEETQDQSTNTDLDVNDETTALVSNNLESESAAAPVVEDSAAAPVVEDSAAAPVVEDPVASNLESVAEPLVEDPVASNLESVETPVVEQSAVESNKEQVIANTIEEVVTGEPKSENNTDFLIEEFPDDEFNIESIIGGSEKKDEAENLIVDEIKNEIQENNLNLINEIKEPEKFNDLIDAQNLLKQTQEELELFKKMSTEKDQKIIELKNQFRQFVQNLD